MCVKEIDTDEGNERKKMRIEVEIEDYNDAYNRVSMDGVNQRRVGARGFPFPIACESESCLWFWSILGPSRTEHCSIPSVSICWFSYRRVVVVKPGR